MILPAMGMVSDIISTSSPQAAVRLSADGLFASPASPGSGFIVWGHHMFQSGMDPRLGTGFMLATIMIALPSAVKVFNWLGTTWQSNMQFTTPMLNALAFVAMFVIGGLSRHLHGGDAGGHVHPRHLFHRRRTFTTCCSCPACSASSAAIYFWFPKMFGRMMNDTWGKVHFALTFVAANCTFYPMHIIGIGGMPRRYAMPADAVFLQKMQPINTFISISAYVMGAATLIFVANFVYSLFFGPKAGRNPWRANSLEWSRPVASGPRQLRAGADRRPRPLRI